MNLFRNAKSQGFTIVELLIVIVVIAIIAAITIVSYNGATGRAEESAMQSSLRTAANKVALERQSGSYPDGLGAAGIDADQDGFTLSYSRGSGGRSFCLQAVSDKDEAKSFYISSEMKSIEEGDCSEYGFTVASCFAFNSGTGTITDYYSHVDNNSSNSACPVDVSVPSQIGGVSVVAIGSSVFYDFGLKSAVLPPTVTSIGSHSFTANDLKTIVIPDSVTTIGPGAFQGNNLTYIDLPDSVVTIETSAFLDNDITFVVIPDSVTSVGFSAFGSNDITSVSLPSHLSSLQVNSGGGWVFYGNPSGIAFTVR